MLMDEKQVHMDIRRRIYRKSILNSKKSGDDQALAPLQVSAGDHLTSLQDLLQLGLEDFGHRLGLLGNLRNIRSLSGQADDQGQQPVEF